MLTCPLELTADPDASTSTSEVFRMVVCTEEQLIWRELEHLGGFQQIQVRARLLPSPGSANQSRFAFHGSNIFQI